MTQDPDLQKIKALFAQEKPADLELQKWKTALRFRRKENRSIPLWAQWLVAASIGFAASTLFFQHRYQELNSQIFTAKNNSDDATFETVYVNID